LIRQNLLQQRQGFLLAAKQAHRGAMSLSLEADEACLLYQQLGKISSACL
jgi:hypothetical protein